MKILSLHGGGMLGYMSLLYLKNLEEKTGKTVPEMFDLIGGVSTGCLIAFGYAGGKTTDEMLTLYENLYDKIFGKRKHFLVGLFKPFYEIENLESALIEEFGEFDIKDSKVRMLTYAVELNNGNTLRTKFWKSWEDSEIGYKVACASCAAPAMFRPYKIGDYYYADGGVATNNPAMCLVSEAMKEGVDPSDIKLLSLWTEEVSSYKDPSKLHGLINVIRRMSNLFTKTGEDVVDYQVGKIVGKLSVVKPDASMSIDSNDFEKMKKAVGSEWKKSGEETSGIFK